MSSSDLSIFCADCPVSSEQRNYRTESPCKTCIDALSAARSLVKGTPAPNGMKYMLCRLDSCLGNSYYATQEDFVNSAEAMLREKRPYHGYEWVARKGRYVLTQVANHPYPEP